MPETEAEPKEIKFHIQIDRKEYVVDQESLTGEQLRHVPPSGIGPELDLFEVIPGGSDIKIANDQVVAMHNGLRFFSTPAHINAGARVAR